MSGVPPSTLVSEPRLALAALSLNATASKEAPAAVKGAVDLCTPPRERPASPGKAVADSECLVDTPELDRCASCACLRQLWRRR